MKKIWKLLIFNAVFACVCIWLFSPGYANLRAFPPAGDPSYPFYKVILFFVAVLGLIAAFVYVNSAILSGTKRQKKIKLVSQEQLTEPKDYIKALQSNLYKKDFERPIGVLVDQIRRVSPKEASLKVILEQRFDKGEMTYTKFSATLDDVMTLFYENTKKAINRISVFDENEYRMLLANQLNIPEQSRQLKLRIYREHIEYVNAIIKRNEYIITLIDNLILEISKLEELNSQNTENMEILQDMKKLIQNTKYYAD